jgi:lysozyme
MNYGKRLYAYLRDKLMAQTPDTMEYLLPLVTHFEGYFPNWYKCSSGVDTIGYGHTGSINGLQSPPWSEPYAAEVLSLTLREKYIPAAIEALAKCGIAYDLLQPHQQAAIVSLCYNAGPGSIWMRSGKPASWAAAFKADKSRTEIAAAWYLWNKSGGKVSPGLVRRRFAEMVLFWDMRLDYDPIGWRGYYNERR